MHAALLSAWVTGSTGTIVSDILYIHIFDKESSQLCAHFSVCVVHLYCYHGPFILHVCPF